MPIIVFAFAIWLWRTNYEVAFWFVRNVSDECKQNFFAAQIRLKSEFFLKALQSGNKLEFQRSNFNITTMKKPIIQALIQAQSNFVSSLEDFVHKILYLWIMIESRKPRSKLIRNLTYFWLLWVWFYFLQHS